jgi:hypothetical protein
MVAHLDNPLVQNIVLGAARDQVLKVKKKKKWGIQCVVAISDVEITFIWAEVDE